jgi:Tol biopolymer transport system component
MRTIHILIACILGLMATACYRAPTATPTLVVTVLPTATLTQTATITVSPPATPTATPKPISTATEMPAPTDSPTLVLTSTPTPIQNDGVFFPSDAIRLTYDPAKWFKGFYQFSPSDITWIKNPGLSLIHTSIPGCWIGTNWGHGLPEGIDRRDTTETLGSHVYFKMAFYGSNGGQFNFAVYDNVIAVDYPNESEECLADIRDVLSTYLPIPVPVETLVFAEATGEPSSPIFEFITWVNSNGSGKKQVNYFFDLDTWHDFAFYVDNPTISPNGRYLAAGVTGLFLAVDFQTNDQIIIAKEGFGHGSTWHPASWTPDSNRLVVSYGEQLFLWDAITHQARRFETPYEDLMPAWSPDGGSVAFTRYEKETFEMHENKLGQLCLMKPDGSELRVLSEQAFFQGITVADNLQSLSNVLSWSPDGQWIAFLSGDPPDIAIVNVQTGETRLLASDPAKDVNPSWSPDGGHIAFASNRNGRDQIFTIKPDGSDLLLLTTDLEEGHAYAPVWSPLGLYIAFLTWDQKVVPDGLWVMNADGSDKVLIQEKITQHPFWSPIPAP